ncbi:thioredoxin-like protein [Cyathus striatus]|nr:thioredoxin-like protein [Cyathus striatus]
MTVNPDEDTEFNDALRKHGILPPRPKTPPTPSPPSSPTLEEALEDFDEAELLELAEDAHDEETEHLIAQYHQRRLDDERNERKRACFGRVYPISREDYTREVTDASKFNEADDEKERGTGVVCFLYKDGIPRSDRAFTHIRTLAERYPRTKFVSIVGVKLPVFLMYRKGEVRIQIFAWGADRERQLEALLLVMDIIDPPEHKRAEDRRRNSDDEDDDYDDDDRSSNMQSAGAFTNTKSQKNIRGPAKKDDDSSDFEFDL